MLFDKDFYAAYLGNHFKIKSRNAAYFLNMNEEELDNHIRILELGVNRIKFLKTIKLDLIQEYYQSIENLFGLIYCLQKPDNQLSLPDALVNMKVKELHDFIDVFKSFDDCYNFLRETVFETDNLSVTKLQYLFYFVSSLLNKEDYGNIIDLLNEDNYKGFALMLNSFAMSFNQEAHNSIKHGLRCMIVDKLQFNLELSDEVKKLPGIPEIPEEYRSWSSSDDTLMYITKEKGTKTATRVFVPIQYKRIVFHEDGISKLLYNLLSHRATFMERSEKDELIVFHHHFSYEKLKEIDFIHNSNFTSIRISEPE